MMKTKEVAELLGVGSARVYQLQKDGRLMKIDGKWDADVVRQLAAERAANQGVPKSRKKSTRSRAGKKNLGAKSVVSDSRFVGLETGELVEWIVLAQGEAKRRQGLLARVIR